MSLKESGGTGIEFGNLRIVRRLINLLPSDLWRGKSGHSPWWERMSGVHNQSKAVKSSLWQAHWSESHRSNPTAIHDAEHTLLCPTWDFPLICPINCNFSHYPFFSSSVKEAPEWRWFMMLLVQCWRAKNSTRNFVFVCRSPAAFSH